MSDGPRSDATSPICQDEDTSAADAHSRPVFISYASQDAATAHSVVRTLEHAGVSCWIAPRDVKPGTLYADGIIHAINDASALILLLSAASIASAHVRKEIERASSKHRPIITMKLDSASLTPTFEYFLSESQWIEWYSKGPDAGAQKLFSALSQVTGVPITGDTGHRPPATDSRTTQPIRRWILLSTAIVVVCSLVLLIVQGLGRDGLRFESRRGAAAPAPSSQNFTPPPHSIAVLPFVNMSGDSKQVYFSDGISEELLNSLSRLKQLQVIARTSSFAFKGKDPDIAAVARKLNVKNILEGSVRRSGDTVRISAQLVDTISGYQLWSKAYDRKVDDILLIQSDVSEAVGKIEDAHRELEQLMRARADAGAMDYSEIYALWGENQAALKWLLKAEALNDPGFHALKWAWPFSPSIRQDPAFKAVEARMKYPARISQSIADLQSYGH